ncbi:hypothetical protein Q5752_004106 [Cryptotrichosporon argae]
MENITPDMSKSAMAAGSIASRFISQDAVDEAKERRDKEWREAYARIGQAPPERKEEFVVHDGRTLAERIESAKAEEQAWWDDQFKLGNQYRGINAEEHAFLSEVEAAKREAERKVREEVDAGLREYREALAHRNAAAELDAPAASASESASPAPASASASTSHLKRPPPKPAKKDVRALLKNAVVVKKKVKAKPAPEGAGRAPVKLMGSTAAAASGSATRSATPETGASASGTSTPADRGVKGLAAALGLGGNESESSDEEGRKKARVE